MACKHFSKGFRLQDYLLFWNFQDLIKPEDKSHISFIAKTAKERLSSMIKTFVKAAVTCPIFLLSEWIEERQLFLPMESWAQVVETHSCHEPISMLSGPGQWLVREKKVWFSWYSHGFVPASMCSSTSLQHTSCSWHWALNMKSEWVSEERK